MMLVRTTSSEQWGSPQQCINWEERRREERRGEERRGEERRGEEDRTGQDRTGQYRTGQDRRGGEDGERGKTHQGLQSAQ